MHPHFKDEYFQFIVDLIFSDEKDLILNKMIHLGLIDKDQRQAWVDLFSKESFNDINVINFANKIKLKIDPLIAKGGILSPQRTKDLAKNVIHAMNHFDSSCFSFKNLQSKSAIDFGAGIHSPLSLSIILYANGFDKVYAFEPYPIDTKCAHASIVELVSRIYQFPNEFNFSGIDSRELVQRVVGLNFLDLENRLDAYSKKKVDSVSLGPITLINDFRHIPSGTVDFQCSNAVLEHVEEFQYHTDTLMEKMSPHGVGIHIVDFLDHRYYDDNRLHPFEKYYDGTLFEINGLLPSEMEAHFLKSGFEIKKLVAQTVPKQYFDDEAREIVGKYANHDLQELSHHLIYYCLAKAA